MEKIISVRTQQAWCCATDCIWKSPIVHSITINVNNYSNSVNKQRKRQSQLNLNMDTGIREAMQKDSGLRLYAEGGGVIGVSSSPGLPIAGATMGGGMAESVSETMAAPGGFDTLESMVASGVDPANAAAAIQPDNNINNAINVREFFIVLFLQFLHNSQT